MYFDTHAHYDNEAFDADRDKVLSSLPEKGVSLVLIPGCDLETSVKAIALSKRYVNVYAAVGWHPHEAQYFDDESEQFIIRAAVEKKVVAVGEIGLDFHYDHSPRDTQRKVFRRQMELARETKLPVIIHDREAHAECLDMAREFSDVRGVFHCYSGSVETARELIKLGWYLSFTGTVTFKDARRALEAIGAVPLERIMLETDSPYLAPAPYRGRRCDSSMLPYIAQTVADVKRVSVQEIAEITMKNGCDFFNI